MVCLVVKNKKEEVFRFAMSYYDIQGTSHAVHEIDSIDIFNEDELLECKHWLEDNYDSDHKVFVDYGDAMQEVDLTWLENNSQCYHKKNQDSLHSVAFEAAQDRILDAIDNDGMKAYVDHQMMDEYYSAAANKFLHSNLVNLMPVDVATSEIVYDHHDDITGDNSMCIPIGVIEEQQESIELHEQNNHQLVTEQSIAESENASVSPEMMKAIENAIKELQVTSRTQGVARPCSDSVPRLDVPRTPGIACYG